MKTAGCVCALILISSLAIALPLDSPGGRRYTPGRRSRAPLSISFAGDIMAHSINYEMDDFAAIYRDIEYILRHDDLSFGNLEFPMFPGTPQRSFPDFNVHPEYVEAAVYAGFDVFSVANNHVMDQGTGGVLSTLGEMERIGSELPYRIWISGIKHREEEWTVTEIRMKGWKIGFAAVSQYSNTPPDRDLVRIVDYRKKGERERFLRWVGEESEKYDLFILSYHGGVEYRRTPDPEKKAFFSALIDSGVDILYGHHPHVLQPVELVHTDEGEKIIFYSCGNLISGQNRIIDPDLPWEDWSYTGDAAIFRIEVVDVGGMTSIGIKRPLLIGNVITPDRDVLIRPLETLAQAPLYGGWNEFYQGRFEIMSSWVERDFLIESGFPRPAPQ